jgi:hypothetical protein
MPEKPNSLLRTLSILTIFVLAAGAMAGLILGVYDIVYTAMLVEPPQLQQLVSNF